MPKVVASKAQEIIYRDGDPLGNVYVVLNGSVVIHRALQEDAMGGKPRGAKKLVPFFEPDMAMWKEDWHGGQIYSAW